MKTAIKAVAAVVVLGFLSSAALADGMIVPVDPSIPVRGNWRVKFHHVDILVRDQVASVNITQEFINTGSGMIEVEYLFPVPPGAAIDSMTLLVNGKEFTAKLLKADEARKIYEDIVRKKKDPALLEYAGFGLYRTRAFPLEPGKPAKVVVTYKYICKKDNDLVEVWYPLNTEKFSAAEIEDVKVRVDIKAAADISAVYSPTHGLKVDRKSPQHVIATYHEKKVLPTTDIQVFYNVAEKDVGATFLTYQPVAGEDGYFMLLVSPNPRTAETRVVPKDVVVVFDRSGSMSGEKINQAKDSLRFILNNLNEKDRFNIIAYNDTIEPFFEHLTAVSKEKIDEAKERLDRIDARGGTNIHDALEKAMSYLAVGSLADSRPGPKYVIFLTDGLATVGKTDEKTILADTQKANITDARLFAFGVGYDVNVRLLDKLVRENNGRSDYVKPNEPIEAKISSLYAKIKNPVMTNLKMRLDGFSIRDMYPSELGDLFEGDQIVVVGRYSQVVWGTTLANPQLVITGQYGGKERGFEYPVKIGDVKDSRYAFVEKLWAMRRVGWLLDQIQLNGESKEVIDELVQLSMKYGIITPYTSFLADERTDLGDADAIRERAEVETRALRTVRGSAGQVHAMNRQQLNQAAKAPAAYSAGRKLDMYGYSKTKSYEAGEAETVSNVRNIGNQSLYRRGRSKVWQSPEVAKLDLKKDKDKIQIIERFSDEYFALVRANNVEENQILSAQQAGEELLISLRGQAYLIR